MSDSKQSGASAAGGAGTGAAAGAGKGAAAAAGEPQLTKQQQTIRLLRSHVFMVRKGVVLPDPRLLTRVLRQVASVRKQLTLPVMKALTQQYAPPMYHTLVNATSALMVDTTAEGEEDLAPPVHAAPTPRAASTATTDASSSSSSAASSSSSSSSSSSAPSLAEQAASAAAAKRAAEAAENARKEAELLAAVVPEVDIYVQLLVAYFLLDQGLLEESGQLADALFAAVGNYNRRTLDAMSAKIFQLYALVKEKMGKDQEVRNSLLLAHRTACLQHNEPGQAALSVAILRSYLRHHLYAQADTFRLKSNFPDQRSNALTARYCYYIGKIHAVQLHYSDAYAALQQSLRKAPQQGAVGFRQAATKLLVLVQLLMGDIPERSLFSPKDLRRSLVPYLHLTQAVRVGDLTKFTQAMAKHRQVFEQDGIYSLIVRLRSNVIKAGLRKINLAYSHISIRDICARLQLDSIEDGEYMVAKAIHDGVIEATVDREAKEVTSKEVADVYATNEPQQAYHKRIQFTMDIHQQAVKSLRYPTSTRRGGLDYDTDSEDDEDTIAGNLPDKREEEKKKEDK